jgi:hypothetical protein
MDDIKVGDFDDFDKHEGLADAGNLDPRMNRETCLFGKILRVSIEFFWYASWRATRTKNKDGSDYIEYSSSCLAQGNRTRST